MSGLLWKQTLTAVPGIGVSLMPKLICPLCWPAYASIVSSVGLSFLIGTTYLLPLTATLLGMTAASLALRARRRHGYGPLGVGSVGALLILGGKFGIDSITIAAMGFILLLGAAIWNASPIHAESSFCPTCSDETRINTFERR